MSKTPRSDASSEEREFEIDEDSAHSSGENQTPRSTNSDRQEENVVPSNDAQATSAGPGRARSSTSSRSKASSSQPRSRSSSRDENIETQRPNEDEEGDKQEEKEDKYDSDHEAADDDDKSALVPNQDATPRQEEKSDQKTQEATSAPQSPGAKSAATTNFSSSRARARRSLETIDLDQITEKDLAKQIKKAGIKMPQGPTAKLFHSLPKTAFVLFDSPRTLQALAEEGVDPSETLLQRKVQDFMRVSKGDVTCAKIRHDHYEAKRSETLNTLRQRRERIIAQQEEHYSTQRAVRTPVVQPTEELTGTAPPPRAEKRQVDSSEQERIGSPHSDTFSDDSTDEDSSEARKRKKSSAAPPELLNPDEYARKEAERKKAKVLRQAQKMREVMEANAKREQQKQEAMDRIIQQREEREAELAKKRKRQELDRRIKESKAAKKEAELQVLRDKREQAMQAKIVELHNERGRKLQEFEDREERRREKEAQEKEMLNIKRQKKRHRVAIRALAIHDYSEKVAEDQKQALLDRMSKADEVRETLAQQKERELAERKAQIEAQTQETKRKRENAEREFVSKINRYKDKAAIAEEKRKMSEKERQDYFLFRSLQEKDKERERKEITERVRLEDQQRSEELLAQLEAAELHCKEVQEQKNNELRLKAAKHAIILEDRRDKVKRMQRMIQHSIDEAEQAYEEKMQRIENLKREAKEADEYRKQIQYKSAKLAQKMAEQTAKRAMLSAAPGPLDYAAVDAEKFLHGPGPGVNMGAPGHKPKKLDYAPGPGAYGRPDLPRNIKGGILPPKDTVGVADVQHILNERKKKAEKEKKERVKEQRIQKEKKELEQQQRRASSTLPALTGPGSRASSSQSKSRPPRSDSAPLVSTNSTSSKKKSVKIVDDKEQDKQAQSPSAYMADLKDEDFCSSDEYDSGSDHDSNY